MGPTRCCSWPSAACWRTSRRRPMAWAPPLQWAAAWAAFRSRWQWRRAPRAAAAAPRRQRWCAFRRAAPTTLRCSRRPACPPALGGAPKKVGGHATVFGAARLGCARLEGWTAGHQRTSTAARAPLPHMPPSPARLLPDPPVLDEGYRRALAAPADRLFSQLDLGEHAGLLDAVRRLLLPDAALLTAKLHTLNVYSARGFFKVGRPARGAVRAGPEACMPHAALAAACCRPAALTATLHCPACRSRTVTPRAAIPTLWARWWCACRWGTLAAACASRTRAAPWCTSGGRAPPRGRSSGRPSTQTARCAGLRLSLGAVGQQQRR